MYAFSTAGNFLLCLTLQILLPQKNKNRFLLQVYTIYLNWLQSSLKNVQETKEKMTFFQTLHKQKCLATFHVVKKLNNNQIEKEIKYLQ